MDNHTTTKVCRQCGIEKSLDGFHKNKNNKGGFENRCKVCRATNSRLSATNNVDATITSKVCTSCKVEQDVDQFTIRRASKDGLAYICSTCQKKRSSQYYKDNHEEMNAKGRIYYEENKEEILIRAAAYRDEHKEEIDAYFKEFRKTHSEKRVRQATEYKESHREWYDAYHAEYSKEWDARNQDKRKAYIHNRRARKTENGGTHTADELIERFIEQQGLCYWCDKELIDPFQKGGCKRQTHLDHVIPLKRGGRNSIENLVWACQPCNNSKGAKLPSEWVGSNGRWKE